jgi:hypothetical protein
MARAQGSLEYLIIIAAAISITAVVTLLVINYFSTNTEQYFYASCRQVASTCKTTLFANPNDPCNACDTACKYANGSEIFPSAIECCKFGEPSEIYAGSLGAACVPCTSDADCTGGKKCCGASGLKRCMTPRCSSTADCQQPACYSVECINGGTCGAYCKNTPKIPCIEETNISDIVTQTPTAVFAVAIGDANNDGKNDVVIGMDTAVYELRMYENKTGKWVETNISSLLSGGRTGSEDSHTKIYSIDIGDTDNDGLREIAIAGEVGGSNSYGEFHNESGGWIWTPGPSVGACFSVAIGSFGGPNDVFRACSNGVHPDFRDPGQIPSTLAIGDANNDGQNDLVVGDIGPAGNQPYSQLRRDYTQSGFWSYRNITNIGVMIYSVAVGDADNDGRKEVVVGTDADIPYEVRMYKNISGGWALINIGDLSVPARDVKIGDADNDGKNEVVVATGFSDEKEIIMYKYDSDTGEWGRIDIADTPTPVYSIAIGDADNDINHRNEIVAGMNGTDQVRMYRIITS